MPKSKSKTEKPPPEREPLSFWQIDLLTDGMINSSAFSEDVINGLLLLMDDFVQSANDSSLVEGIANTVKTRCYASTADSDRHENAYLERVRAKWLKITS